MKDQFDLALPKWPQMKVLGEKIEKEQALEIIRRTDTFFSYPSGNNHSYIKSVVDKLKMPHFNKKKEETFEANFKNREKWLERWGYITTEYVHNTWISSAFIGGPYGWCHPDGTIQYGNNVGKWPSVEQVYNEWSILAKEFPFIKLDVTLMDGEECEENIQPVTSMRVEDGKVCFVEEDRIEQSLVRQDSVQTFCSSFLNPSREQGLSWDVIEKWSQLSCLEGE